MVRNRPMQNADRFALWAFPGFRPSVAAKYDRNEFLEISRYLHISIKYVADNFKTFDPEPNTNPLFAHSQLLSFLVNLPFRQQRWRNHHIHLLHFLNRRCAQGSHTGLERAE